MLGKTGRARRGEQDGERERRLEDRPLRRGFVSRIKRAPFILVSKHENSDRDKFGKRERTRTRVLLQGRLGYDLRMNIAVRQVDTIIGPRCLASSSSSSSIGGATVLVLR